MIARTAAHRLRDSLVRVAASRSFRSFDSPSNRIVIVRPDHFGDLLMLGPTLQFLKHYARDHEITLMVGSWNEAAARHIAPFCDIVVFDFPGLERSSGERSLVRPYQKISTAANLLRALRPRAIAVMRDDHWWGAWMARDAGIPLRAGYDQPQVAPFLTHPIEMPRKHYVEQNLTLARALVAMLGFPVPEADDLLGASSLLWPVDADASTAARETLRRHQVGGRYIVVHPGTGAPVKLWPEQRWSSLIDKIRTHTGSDVLLTGSADEHGLCQTIASHASANPINLAGETSLFALAEIMRDARLVLGVDSGPLHLACAVGTPSIHLYGPSDQVRYGPWGPAERNLAISADMNCPACGDISPSRPAGCGCMTAISVDQVVDAALGMLQNDE